MSDQTLLPFMVKTTPKVRNEKNREKYLKRIDKIKEYYIINKDKFKERNTEYKERNKERLKLKHKAYRERNKEQIKLKHKAYRERNKERIKLTEKAYRERNKEKNREKYLKRIDKIKEHYIINKDKFKERNTEYYNSVGKMYHKKRYKKQSQSMLWYDRIFNNITRSNRRKQKKGISCTKTDFDAEFILNLYIKQEGKCAYFGITMDTHSAGKKCLLNPSLDRIDNSKGYIKSNVVLCTLMANYARNDASYDEWNLILQKYFVK
jgi:hypothetical protein